MILSAILFMTATATFVVTESAPVETLRQGVNKVVLFDVLKKGRVAETKNM